MASLAARFFRIFASPGRPRAAAALLAAMGLLSALAPPARAADSRLTHAILVIVNGVRLTRSDLDEAAAVLLRQRFGGRPVTLTEAQLEEISTAALREMIKVQLILDEARELKLRVSLSEVDRQLRANDIEPVKASRMQRRFIEAEILFDRILQAGGIPRYEPSPREIRTFRRENPEVFLSRRFIKARHIFVDTEIHDADRARRKLKAIRKETLKLPRHERSAYFAEKARETSMDRFRRGGGLLRISPDKEGWFLQEFPNRGRDGEPLFPEPMVRGIRGLMLGDGHDVSDVIQSEKGLHLLFLEDARGGEEMDRREADKLVVMLLRSRERAQRMRHWLRKKYERSRVLWHDGDPFPLKDILPPAANGGGGGGA